MRLPTLRYLPHIIIGLAAVSALGVAYTTVIIPSATSTTPKVTWTIDPLTISFAATQGSGSATDTFSCSVNAGPVSMRTISSGQAIELTVSPNNFANCGSSLLQVTVTATCLVPATNCRGTFNGQVQVRQPTNYRNLANSLQVNILVG